MFLNPMSTFKLRDKVYPRWSQYEPAFVVIEVDVIMIKVEDDWGNKAYMHKDDLVLAE